MATILQYTKSKLIIWSVAALFLGSCHDKSKDAIPLKACFDLPAAVNAGSTIQFTSECSENETSYLWDFGGLATGTEANPAFTFTTPGTFTVRLTVSDGNNQRTVEKQITVGASACIEHNYRTITANETWKSGETHCISNYLSVDGAILTIEPGVTVRFKKSAGMSIGLNTSGSGIIAQGTADKPIIFTSAEAMPKPGDWIGIIFNDGATADSKLSNCIIEYAGSQVYASFDEKVGMIELKHGGSASIQNCTFRHSLSHALKTDFYSGFADFTYNTISDAGDYAIATHVPYAHTIGTGNTITNKGILVRDGGVSQDVTWQKQTCPYYIYGHLAVGSSVGNTLTIAPGVEIRFDESYGLMQVGEDGEKGKLVAVGTPGEKIIFTSAAATPAAGDWSGISFGTGTMAGTTLNHVEVKYASGDATQFGAIEIKNSNVSIENSLISDCLGIGIDLDMDYTPGFAAFNNNTIIRNGGYPIKLYASRIGTIGTGNVLSGNYPVHVTGGAVPQTTLTWRNAGVPYLVNGNLMIGNAYNSTAETVLTFEAGTVLKFTTNSGVSIGVSNPVLFKAIGTADKPVIFTSSAATPAAGDWDGIEFYDGIKAGSVMEYCHVKYGGGRYANISASYITTAGEPLIKNCTITHSLEYGVYKYMASPRLEGNTYASNVKANTN